MARRTSGNGVNTEEVEDLRRDVRASARDLADLKVADEAVAELVAGKARSGAYGLGGVAAKTAPSLTASSGTVSLGDDPFAFGAEFGGQGRPTTQQFRPHRGTTGYFLYPAIRATRDEANRIYENRIDSILKRHDL